MTVLNPLTVPRGDYRYVRKTQEVACLASDAVGEIMCMRGFMTPAGRWRVHKANNLESDRMPAVGVLIEKKTGTTGIMQIYGAVVGLFTGLDYTKKYFVGSNGVLDNVLPVPTLGNKILVQKFGVPVDTDVLWLSGEIGTIYTRKG